MLKLVSVEEEQASSTSQPNFVFVDNPRSDSVEDEGESVADVDAKDGIDVGEQSQAPSADWQPGGVCLECQHQDSGLPKPHYAAAMGHLGCLMSIYIADMESLLTFDSADRSPLFYACANVSGTMATMTLS